MNSKDRREAARPADSLMSPTEVSQLMVYMLRQPTVYKYAVDEVRPEYFSKEPHYKLLWRSVLEAAPAYDGVVPFDEVYTRVDAALGDLDQPLPRPILALLLATEEDLGAPIDPDEPGEVVERPGIIWHAHRVVRLEDLDETYGLRTLKRFLRERTVYDAMKTAIDAAGDRQPGGFGELVEEMRKRDMRIEGIGESNVLSFDAFPETLDVAKPFSTGIKILDYFMDGGQCDGEVYALIEPQKATKTFKAMTIAIAAAEHFDALAAAGGESRYSNYLFYEMTPDRVRQRIYSRGADVNLDRLMYDIKRVDDMSRRGLLLPYELEMYKERGRYDFAELPGERDRIEAFNRGPGQRIRAVDMRAGGSGAMGTMLGDGVAMHLEREASAGRTPGVLVVDYVNLAARNYLIAKGRNLDREMRATVLQFVAQMVEVAAKFDIPVWLIQQFSADMQSASPTRKPSANDAAEARTIGENVDFVFCGGKPKKYGTTFQVALLGQDIGRRGGHDGEWRLCGVRPKMGRITDETDNFIVDYDRGEIEEKAESAARIDAAARTMFQAPREADPFKAAEGLADDELY